MHFNSYLSYCSAGALSASLDSFSYLVLAVFPGMPELTPRRRILHGEAILHQFWLSVFLLTGDMLLTLLLLKLSTFLPVGTLQGGSPLLRLVTVITLLFFSALITHKQTTSLTYFPSSSFIVYMPYGGKFLLLLVSFTLALQVVEHYKLLTEQQEQLSTKKLNGQLLETVPTDTGRTGNAFGLCSIESSLSLLSVSKWK